MIKKFFVMVAVAAVFAACGGNQPAKNAEEGKECAKECTADASVCITKAIDTPAEFAEKEGTFKAKMLSKCDSTGFFYACADSVKYIQVVPAEGVDLTALVGQSVLLTGKVVDGKVQVSKGEAKPACEGEGHSCGDKKEGEACCGDKKEACGDKKEEGCCDKKAEAKS